MKKFILRTMGFFTLLIFGGNIINITNLLLFKKIIFYHHDGQWVNNLKNAPKLILMGSSTIRNGLSPKNICDHSAYSHGDVVNIAFNAATPIQNYYLYKTIEANIDRAAIVIYGVDPWIFSKRYYRYDARLQVYWSLQQRFYVYYKGFVGIESILWGGNFATSAFKPFYYGYKKYLAPKRIDTPEDFGASQLKQIPKNFGDPVATFFDYEIFELSDLQFEYLAKIQQDVQKKGKTFVLLFPPKRSDWRRDYNTHCQEIEIAFLEKLNHYLSKSIVVGRVDDIPVDLETTFFNDGVHLNAKGQEYYSRLLAEQHLSEIHISVSEKIRHVELSTEFLTETGLTSSSGGL